MMVSFLFIINDLQFHAIFAYSNLLKMPKLSMRTIYLCFFIVSLVQCHMMHLDVIPIFIYKNERIKNNKKIMKSYSELSSEELKTTA